MQEQQQGQETGRSTARSSTGNVPAKGDTKAWKPRGAIDSVGGYFEAASEPTPEHRFGKRVRNQVMPHEHQEWDFLRHREEPQWRPSGSLKETRFHKGFQRGRVARDSRPTPRHDEPFRTTPARTEKLSMLNGRCREYDIINGGAQTALSNQQYPVLTRSGSTSRAGKRLFSGKGESAEQRVYLPFKFHQPVPVTRNSVARRGLLASEGMSAKKSSLLGYGRADLSSRGVEDNFSAAAAAAPNSSPNVPRTAPNKNM